MAKNTKPTELNVAGEDAADTAIVYGYANENDILIGLSTSGNSENVVNAAIVAKAKGAKVIASDIAEGPLLSAKKNAEKYLKKMLFCGIINKL